MFPLELERDAFRATNGEFGWTHDQIPTVVGLLLSHRMGILGGELWWVSDGAEDWGLLPQRDGQRAVYCWTTDRRAEESWSDFVERGAKEALAAVNRFPYPNDLPPDSSGRILYNLTWATDKDFARLVPKVG